VLANRQVIINACLVRSEASIRSLILGTRGSPLALLQTRRVIDRLAAESGDRQFDLKIIRTLGDREQSMPLHAFPTMGVFVHEIGSQLLAGTIDIAVHSLKDIPPGNSPGLVLAAFPERADPRDVIVSRNRVQFSELPSGARVGTSSVRRQAQLRASRPDLTYCDDLRGNVDTRVRKLREGQYDAIVLAAAGLIRLGRGDEITESLDPSICLPDAGQGTLGVQTRADDDEVRELVSRIDNPAVRATALAERALLEAFGGGCKVPVAAFAQVVSGELCLEGLVASTDGKIIVRAEMVGPVAEPVELGRRVWSQLVQGGAATLLSAPDDV
jgi:hydroxymethylbilane synthase